MQEKTYIAIDLKSFYASVECKNLGLNALEANLVVADKSRTEKTICLAVSPTLKSFGIPGRPRLFEVIQKVKEINRERLKFAPGRRFTGKSTNLIELNNNPSLELDFIIAKPQMADYMRVSSEIFSIYLEYIAPEDIHVYSVDEVFIDATAYLKTYKMTAREFTTMLIQRVLNQTQITATAGIGTNLYLCKIAMDVEAKHIKEDKYGVRIAELDEMSYRRKLWSHKPLKDFWRVGYGISRTLEANGMFTMGDIARKSIENEELLYKLFGINAELLIDHAWGWEPCTIKDIKSYKPESGSISCGQVLQEPYTNENARLIVREMADNLVLDLVDKHLVTNQIVLTICFDTENIKDKQIMALYKGEISKDWYGRQVPKQAHGSINLGRYTSSDTTIVSKSLELFSQIADKNLLVRRIYIVANNTKNETEADRLNTTIQPDLFSEVQNQEDEMRVKDMKDRERTKAILEIKKKFGKNSILKVSDYEKAATAKQRNSQVGGHNA